MASVRRLKDRHGRPRDAHRIDAKRTYSDGTQIRWGHTYHWDPRLTPKQNETEAEAIGIQAERDLDAGVHPQARFDRKPDLCRPSTVGDWIRKVGAEKAFKTRETRATWWSYMNVHVLPVWEDVPIDDEHVTPARLRSWVDGLDLAPRSIRSVHGALKTVMMDAIEDPAIPLTRSPYVRIRLPKPEPTGRRCLTAAEVLALCAWPQRAEDEDPAPEWWGIFKRTLFFTGMRIGELLSRDVRHFAPLAGIAMPPTSAQRRGQAAERTEVAGRAPRRRTAGKTPAAVRYVHLCGSHRAELIAHVGDRTSGPLFLSTRGQRPGYDTAYEMFANAADGVGLPAVSPHWARYTHKTWLADHDVHPRAIDHQLGHEPEGMGRYITPTAPMLARIPAVLEERWREVFGVSSASSGQVAR